MFQTARQQSSEHKAFQARSRPKPPAAIGNQTMLRQMQAKLAVSKSGGPAELEADRVADQMMLMTVPVSIHRKCSACAEEEKLQRKYAECEEEEKKTGLQKRESGAEPQFALTSVHDVLNTPGQSLDPSTRAFMEPRFGYDFSQVRVHTDQQASESAREINALAYTVDSDIIFGPGKYAPQTGSGRHLIAHELAHVIQQSNGVVMEKQIRRSPDGKAEKEESKKPARKPATGHKGCAMNWENNTTCLMWGVGYGTHKKGKGTKKRSETCCDSFPDSVDKYARVVLGLNGAASCQAVRNRQTATVSWRDKTVKVLCADTIPPGNFAEDVRCKDHGQKHKQVIELSEPALAELTGSRENRDVSVTYSGTKAELCSESTGKGLCLWDLKRPEKASHEKCITPGCPMPTDTPENEDSDTSEMMAVKTPEVRIGKEL